VHLEFGEPDFETPEVVREAAVRAIREGRTKYAHSLGLLALREAIAEHYQETYRVAVSPDQVLVTAGTSPAMLLLFTGLLSPGDEVVLSNPHYACYPNFVRYADATPVYVPTPESEGWSLGAEAVRERLGPRTRAVMVNSPANPTGVVTPADRLRALADVAERHGAWLVSDEIYHGLSYEGPDHTVLEYTDRAFVFNGFSKAYAMTGWRLGYLVAPKSYVRTLQRLHQNFFISSNEFVQWAGVAALREAAGDVRRFRAVFDERRRAMVGGLRALGLGVRAEPTGVLRLRGCPALHGAVLRLRVRDPRRRPRGCHARRGFRIRRRGLSPVLVREQPAAHPRGSPAAGRVPPRARWPRLTCARPPRPPRGTSASPGGWCARFGTRRSPRTV
jgi:(5-formylfuran-3-yl)methyl phosphate transaminase